MPAAYVPSTCVQPKGKPVKIFSFLRHHKINFVIALVLLCIQANLELAVPGVMSNIVDIGIARGGIVGEAPVGATASELARIQTDYILGQGAHMLVLTLLSVACSILAAYNASKTSAAIGREVRHALYERVLSYSPAEMEKFSSASLITRATNDIQQIQMITVMCLRIVLFAPCMGVGAVVRVLSTRRHLHHRHRHRHPHGAHHAQVPPYAGAGGPQQPHRARDLDGHHADPRLRPPGA